MITVDTIVEAKRKYIIDHVMPSDLSDDIKEGLRIKEEMIANVTAESIEELTPNINETIQLLNEQGVSEEKYVKFMNGEISQVELYAKPDPATFNVRYCVDNKPLEKYKENTRIELKVPERENSEGRKETSIYVLIQLSGELNDMYKSKNCYWSIIPKDSTPPNPPDFIQIRFKGSIPKTIGGKTINNPREEALPSTTDITTINFINNNITYTSLDDLKAQAVSQKLVTSEEIYKIDLWSTSFNFIALTQPEVPNFTKTVELNDGDIYKFSGKNYCYSKMDQNKWVELPSGLSNLNESDNYSFLSMKKVSFSEEDAEIQTVSGGLMKAAATGVTEESSTGGLYCLTDQLVCTKYEDVETDVFVYMHVTATKQEEKKQKCCSKSGNCSKSSSSCDKGQTDTAIKHEPAVNKPWFNNMMDHILHSQIDPLIAAVNALGQSLNQVALGVCPDGAPLSTAPIVDNLATSAQNIANAIIPRDIEVDAACSLIMDAAESAVNSAIDSAISDFNNIVDDSMNSALTSAMNSVAATSALSRRMKASNGSDPEIEAISNANKAALAASTTMMAEFSQSICDVRMMDNGNGSSLDKIKAAIEVAKQKAAAEAEIEAAKIANQYIKDCMS